MATVADGQQPVPAPSGALDRVLCAVDDGPGSLAAVRETIAIGPGARRVHFIAVTSEPADATGPVASLDWRRARHALELAQAQAAAHGVSAGIQLVEAPHVADALIERSGDHDLLVAGISANSRLAGGGCVHLIHVQGRGYGPHTRHRLAELSLELMTITAAEPVVDVLRGARVAEGVAEFARRCDASLLVIGRRGLSGLRALGSVSERLVHSAPCSVLVASAP